MDTDRTCFSCDTPVNGTLNIPVVGVKKAFFCGDHFQLGSLHFCHPCAGQITRLAADKSKSSAGN